MRQLPLQISQPAEPSFDNFIAGENAEALARVRQLASGELREAIVYLWGETGSGRTHLLRAAARANASLTIADDAQTLDADGQQWLFGAINAARDGRGAVLAAGSAPPPPSACAKTCARASLGAWSITSSRSARPRRCATCRPKPAAGDWP